MTTYTVQPVSPKTGGGDFRYIQAASLAALCNIIRGWNREVGTHYKVWNLTSGLQLIDTRFSDAYNLTEKETYSELQV